MSDTLNIADFLHPINLFELSGDQEFKDGQIGKMVLAYEHSFPDLSRADIVIVGCGEERGNSLVAETTSAPDNIREQLYFLYYWHPDIQLADVGNIKAGASLSDTYAALKTVIRALTDLGKTVLIIGGGHDLTLAQYYACVDAKKIIEGTCIDALINIDINSILRSQSFLMEVLTGEPNFMSHYNHIGFQSYFVHPRMLETMDKLRFDCYRVGKAKENIEEMEPVIRNSSIVSFDIAAIANSYAPSNELSPNGFSGEEACALMRFAGLSSITNSIGIYGYDPAKDKGSITAKQISQMIWYLLDGKSRGKKEARIEDRDAFNEFHVSFAEVSTTFLQSKKTGRWWMQLPDKKFIACSHKDYLLAGSNEIPERWLRTQERN
ncbi:MAG: formimidoylglutamase [Chitinophagaceae bacterium]|nr:formimidoylglutamase [Chitinophagaceae bacterium]